MILRNLIIIVFFIGSLFANGQTDFPALKHQFLDYRNTNKQDSALYIARKMNNLALKEQADTSYWYALSMRYMGNPHFTWRNIDSAVYYWKKSEEFFEKFHSSKNDYSIVLNSLGVLYDDLGDFKNAEFYYKLAYQTCIEKIENSQSLMADISNNLGILYASICDYKSAENYYLQALSILKKNDDLDVYLLAEYLNNLGTLYDELGDYKIARQYYEESYSIRLKISTDKKKDLNIAGSLNNLGVLYNNIKEFYLSEQYLDQSLEIYQNVLGFENVDLAMSINNLAILNFNKGNYRLAIELFSRSYNIYLKLLGNYHLKVGDVLMSLANSYTKISNYEMAFSFYYNCQNVYQHISCNADKISLLERNISYLLAKTNRKSEAYNLLSKNLLEKSKQIADNFEWLNDNQKEAYWKKEIEFYDNLSWFAHEAHEKVPESVGLNYNAALITKSKMLEAKISSENYYREVDELRDELAYRRRLLAKMESDGSTEKEKLEKLRYEADSLDKRLTLSWPEYAQQKKNLSISWDQVQQNLDKGEATIEFVRFKNEDDSVVYYNALVLKKGDQNPTLVKLCKEKELQSISPEMGYSAYYPLVWQPMEEALKDVNTIYYAPTGELYNVPFHAIYASKGKGDELIAAKTNKRGITIENEKTITENNAEYLMDRFTMHQLTSTRYLAMGLKQKAKETIGNTIAMVGGVNYDYLPGSKTSTKKNKKEKNASRSSASASGKLNYLEGTKTEAEQINLQVTSSSWLTKLLENNEPIEENITKLEGKEAKGILHLATHGYAFPEYDFKDTSINKNSLRYSYHYSTNPMVRSGLILAGGNWAWTGSDTLTKLGAEQNGILTALEVSQLNLKKTKLVVLSACETGLGKIEGSEGTFGLKRGFKLAGVEQMIVSLWSVPDKETMELMTLFYSDLTKTLNPVISFSNAQKEMRNKYPTEPEKWAGFVLVR